MENKLLKYLFFTQEYIKFIKKHSPELYLQPYYKEQGFIAVDNMFYKAIKKEEGKETERHIKLIKAIEKRNFKMICKLIASAYRTYNDYSKFTIVKIKNDISEETNNPIIAIENLESESENIVKNFFENTPIKLMQIRTEFKRYSNYQIALDFK